MSTEWLVQPKRRCQTWLYLLSYLRYKWRNNEETGFISDKTSNPWAIHVEKSIDEFERGLTPREPDNGDSAPSQAFSTPDFLSDLEGLS